MSTSFPERSGRLLVSAGRVGFGWSGLLRQRCATVKMLDKLKFGKPSTSFALAKPVAHQVDSVTPAGQGLMNASPSRNFSHSFPGGLQNSSPSHMKFQDCLRTASPLDFLAIEFRIGVGSPI